MKKVGTSTGPNGLAGILATPDDGASSAAQKKSGQ
jgi:hypothetical protein